MQRLPFLMVKNTPLFLKTKAKKLQKCICIDVGTFLAGFTFWFENLVTLYLCWFICCRKGFCWKLCWRGTYLHSIQYGDKEQRLILWTQNGILVAIFSLQQFFVRKLLLSSDLCTQTLPLCCHFGNRGIVTIFLPLRCCHPPLTCKQMTNI